MANLNQNILNSVNAEIAKSSVVIARKTLADADEMATQNTIEFYTAIKRENMEVFEFDTDDETTAGVSIVCKAFDGEVSKDVKMVITTINRDKAIAANEKLLAFAIAKDEAGNYINHDKVLHVVGAFGKTDLTKGKFYPRLIELAETGKPLKVAENPVAKTDKVKAKINL